jgi:regulator of cell morphogenesis and NO signaling
LILTKRIPQKGDCSPVREKLTSPQLNPKTMHSNHFKADLTYSVAPSILQRYSLPVKVDIERSMQCEMARNNFLRDLSYSIQDAAHISAQTFAPYSLGLLVEYLHRSHKYYLDKALPEIGNTLEEAVRHSPDGGWFKRYAMPLFRRYVEDTVAHFAYEEQYLFPYALELEKRQRTAHASPELDYSAGEFIASHPDSVIDLPKVIAILSSKEETFSDNIAYRILIKRLRHLEEDMHLHSIIEDEVLVAKLQALEAN